MHLIELLPMLTSSDFGMGRGSNRVTGLIRLSILAKFL
jgi:hypothetical protein